jgi:protein-tyrosine phosphatase
MIDIHCHLLYGVDDGAETIEESQMMLRAAKEQGVEAVILTPHYRHGMFAYPQEAIAEHYAKLAPYAKELGVGLALGTEYHVNTDIVTALESGRCRTLAGSRYVLCEYSGSSEFSYLYNTAQELVLHGYIPVIAHAERYSCLTGDIEGADSLRELGAWIQLNADAILGMEGISTKKFCKKMLKAGYVDVVASDSHGMDRRACHLGKCRQVLTKKFGEEYAGRLLFGNPAKIIAGALAGASPSV